MKAIVHIGAPKTGSSTIQEFLFQNTDALAAQGFRFRRNVPGRGSQYEYPLAALASIDRLLPGVEEQKRYSSTDLATHKATGQAVLAQLDQLLSSWTEQVALFSSEHIYPWILRVDEIAALDAMFRARFDDVRYVLYIRNQEDLIVSEYSEALKRGSNIRLFKLIEQRSPSLDWSPRIRNWISVVGRDRFDLRLMDRDFLDKGDLLDDFAATCGFSMDGLRRLPKLNESLSAAGAACLRMMNERIPQLRYDGQPNPLRFDLVLQLQQMSPPGAAPLALFDAHRTQIRNVVEAGNDWLRQTFFPDRSTLFSPPSERKPAPREQTLEEALDLAARLFIKLRLGEMTVLSAEQKEQSVMRARGGVYNGIAQAPKS